MLAAVSGYLWDFLWFRRLTVLVVNRCPGPFAEWWAVNTPFLRVLHLRLLECCEYALAADLMRDIRRLRGPFTRDLDD